MWIFSAIANAIGNNFIGRPNYLFDLLFNRVQADGGVTEAQQCAINQLTDLQNDNLLSSASLMLTPSSYKEGKLYSVIPTNGNGDFTFTRATTATRVNSSGLVELVPYNLISYSNTFSNAVWTKANTTIVSSNNTAPDGTLTATRLSMLLGNTSQVYNSFPTVAGSYTTSIWVRLVSGSGNFKLGFFDGASILTDAITVTSTWQRFSVTKTVAAAGGTRGCWLYSDDLNQVIEVWGGQVVDGTSALLYQKTETRLNTPRLDYSSGGCPSILLEPQRTNLVERSEEFSNIYWGGNFTSITKNLLSPSGIINADTIVNNIGANRSISRPISVVSGTTYVLSFWIKKISGAYVNNTAIQLSSFGPAVASQTYTNLGTTLTTDWVRYTHTFTATSTNTVYIQLISNEVNTFGLWGAQLEAGSYATSYIPTTSASVTRNADVLTRNNIYTNGLISASGGTWYFELKNNISLTRSAGADIVQSLGVSDGINSGIVIRNSGTSRAQVYKYVSGSPILMRTTAADIVKVAIKWNGTSADVFENGVKVVSASSFTTTNMNFLQGSAVDFPKNISSMLLAPTPLTDAECIQLTTL